MRRVMMKSEFLAGVRAARCLGLKGNDFKLLICLQDFFLPFLKRLE